MSIDPVWNDLVSWCQTSAPLTAQAIEPGVTSADLDRAMAAFDLPWTADLQDFYRLQNGTREDSFALDGLLFGFTPLPLAELLDEATMRTDTAVELFDADEVVLSSHDDAGAATPFWLPSLVPFARHVAANVLCVDLRPGPEHGCVVDFDEDGFGQASWPSLASLLTEVVETLQNGRAHDDLRPAVTDGELTWVFEG